MEMGKKPIVFLTKNIDSQVRVRLKNDLEYRGRLSQCDNYMNLIVKEATEYNDNEPNAKYGNIFIRGNNIILICFEA